MRAARVVDMLLVLQHKGRTTARQLAELLEVSERTVLRDVEALSEAGVPIDTARGAGGGIELLDGFRTQLTGLTAAEAGALFLAAQPALAHRLGLGSAARTARHKLLAALPPARAADADHAASWFLLDPDPWSGNQVPHGELRRIADCIGRCREVELRLGPGPTQTARPMGLVHKAGSWYLVGEQGDGVEVLCLDELRATRITTTAFAPAPSLDLGRAWRDHIASADQGQAQGGRTDPVG